MLQLWLRCWLISGIMLCGWAGMFWVGISGIMFRSSLGGLLCRLQSLWGELSFLFPAPLYDLSAVFVSLYSCCCWLLLYTWWFGSFRLVLISASVICWWWFSVLKCSLLLVLFCWTMWGAVCLLVFIHVARGFFNGCALVFPKFSWGRWLGSGWMVSLGINDHSCILFGLFTCLSWWSILLFRALSSGEN